MTNITKTMSDDKTYIANTYARFPIEITRGRGCLLFGSDGKKYIDMGSGIGVNIFGAADTKWKAAVKKQLDKIQHTSNLYYTEPGVRLAETLCEKTGFKKVFFCNSGAEANEGAIKAARKYAAERKGTEYSTIITLKNSFHGRTITTLAATGQDCFHEHFQPLTQGFVYTPANDAEAMKEAVRNNKLAAIMIECIQGEGGVVPLDSDFVKEIADTAKKNDILLIVDEVQTGNGRTGKLYSYMNYGIEPDIVTTAKGLGGGLPIGAILFGEKTADVLGKGDHGSTFGGNPAVCAGALSVLKRLDEKFLAEVKKKGEYIFSDLKNADGVLNVCGKGLMIGIETEKPPREVIDECIENGVLCLSAKNKVRLLPPLNIPEKYLKQAVKVIKNACKK